MVNYKEVQGLWIMDYQITINFIVGHEDVVIDEAPIFDIVGGKQIELDPITMSTTPGTMNEMTQKIYFLYLYNMNKATCKWVTLIVDVCPTQLHA